MKLFELRKDLKIEFQNNNIDIEDADFIISEILNVKRTELVLIDEISDEQVNEIKQKAELRLNKIPVDKIFHKSYFYGYEFVVDENVLTPRPETEILVEMALRYIDEYNLKSVLDLCTGSGCLAVSIKKNAEVDVTASDVSSKAIKIAKQNADKLGVEVKFIKSNMFENIDGKFDLIVSNPPYIDTDEIELLDEEVKNNDPKLALDGGAMGLKYYNIIHDNLRKYLNEGGFVIMEIGEEQREMLLSMFNDFTFVDCIKDYAGLDRIIIFKK